MALVEQIRLDEPTTPAKNPRPPRLWMPKRVLFTPLALEEPWGQQIYGRVRELGLPVEELRSNRLAGLRGADERATYSNPK